MTARVRILVMTAALLVWAVREAHGVEHAAGLLAS